MKMRWRDTVEKTVPRGKTPEIREPGRGYKPFAPVVDLDKNEGQLPMDNKDVQKKIKEYENFVEEKLKMDLKDIEIILEDKVSKHDDWKDVKQVVKTVKEFKEKEADMSVRVDIGNDIIVAGEITHLENIYVCIGLGYILEMDCDEADKYSNIRMKVLQKEIDHFRKLAVDVKVHIKLVLLAISELQATMSMPPE